MGKINVAVLFGGVSSEHDVSLRSADTVLSNIDTNKYCVLPLGITKKGQWLLYSGDIKNLKNTEWEKLSSPAILSPDVFHKGLLKLSDNKFKFIPVDVIFPVMHGKYGEDGAIQGLFELSQIPYIGCNVLASSISMDKVYTKLIAASFGVTQARYEVILKSEVTDDIIQKIEKSIGYPCFIKPSSSGSSVGISRADDYKQLMDGINNAFNFDDKIIIEEFISGRELECAVIGTKDKKASAVGEVIAAASFYDYDAKYNNDQSKTIVPADIPTDISDYIRKNSLIIFNAVSGTGLSRVDFFLENNTGRIIFNEINTLPGFTSISMYPMLWENAGINMCQLIDILISDSLNDNHRR